MEQIYINRYIEKSVQQDLNQKMVFISGPRQSGKTTLARKISAVENRDQNDHFYLTWDYAGDREKIIRERFPAGKGILVLDEIHKYARWRQVVKGLFDRRKTELKIIVTGSGRLDYYRHGGESLQGRYHFYRLYPFTLKEIVSLRHEPLLDLLNYGGFPEPFITASERETRRWSREYRSRVIYDDVNSLENIKNVTMLEELSLRLPELVGAPLSINALRKDLQVSHQTVTRWLTILENVYSIFRIIPFGPPRIRAVKKETKHYHFDWTLVEEEGARFENVVAVHLVKWVHFQQDYEGKDAELRFFRSKDGKEVDFVVLEKGKPKMFIECKLRGREINPVLRYLKKQFPNADAMQISLYRDDDFVTKEGIRVCPAARFLMELT